jgi:hypothetical protein
LQQWFTRPCGQTCNRAAPRDRRMDLGGWQSGACASRGSMIAPVRFV